MYEISLQAHQLSYGKLIPAAQRAAFDKRYTDSASARAAFVARMKAKLSDPAWRAWVAELDGRIVGHTLVHWVDVGMVKAKGLFVAPDHHGKGIGAALFEASLQSVGRDATVRLSVIENNERARQLYEKYGFKAIGYDDKTFYGARQLLMEGQGLTFNTKNVKVNPSELRNRQQLPPGN